MTNTELEILIKMIEANHNSIKLLTNIVSANEIGLNNVEKDLYAARKSFKDRHKCGTAISKLTARCWSFNKLWAGKGGSTKSSPKSRRGKY